MNDIQRLGALRRIWLLGGLLVVSAAALWSATTWASEAPVAAVKSNKQAAGADAKPQAKQQVEQPSAENKEAEKKEAEKQATESKPAAKEASESTEKEAATPKRPKIRMALLVLKDDLPESLAQAGPFGETQVDLRETINRIEKAAEDKTISGLVLDIRNPTIGRGKLEELRGAIKRFRDHGKKAYAQLESAMPADYLVACACDEIVMPDSGVIMLPGIHAEAMFYKGLLAKLGVQADFIHMGAYKGAAEPLTQEKFSEPVRQNMTELIDGLYDQMVTTIVKDRPLTVAQVKDIIDQGLITAPQAKELGLIDRLAYPDQLRDDLTKSYDAEPLVYVENYGQKDVDTDFSGPMGFVKLMQTLMGDGDKSGKSHGKKIAVIYALGPITSGKSEQSPLGGESMGSTTIVKALKDAADDKSVVAIVLRIDSPGGSALASDLIWHETQVVGKPIVASMGDVAASGGYYIAMGTNKIIAAPGTITGSIGVVGGKLALRGLFDKVGITTETIERGKNSGMFSSSGMFSESERSVVTKMMEETYKEFTTKAAEGRHMPHDKLVELAGGRVYTGLAAKNNGLVDELGTLHDAIDAAKQLAGLDPDADVKIKVLPEPTDFFEMLFGQVDKEKEVRLPRGLELLAPQLTRIVQRAYSLRAVFDQPAALIMPFDLDIR
jgi:protease IV